MLSGVISPLGELPEGWKLARLEDIATKIGSGSTPRGGESAYINTRTNFAFVRSQNVFDYLFNERDIKFITDEDARKLKGVHLEKSDLLLNITGDGVTFGRSCIVPENILPAAVNQHVAIIRLNQSKCLPGYLLAYLCLPKIKEYIEGFNAGGSRRAITKAHIESFEIPLAPMEVQHHIQTLVIDLVEKTLINRQINQTLEQIAQALFKSWFVDFEPVKAKIAAKARWLAAQPDNESASPVCYAGELEPQPDTLDLETTMNLAAMQVISGKNAQQLAQMQDEQPEQYAQLQATAALFPAAMQGSEGGEIPEGWKMQSIAECIELIGGGTPKKSEPSFWNGNICWFSVKDVPSDGNVFVIDTEEKITELGLQKSSTRMLPLGTTIITARGIVGKLALAGVATAINQSCYGVVGADGSGPYYNYLRLSRAVDILKRNTHGAVFGTITRSTFDVVQQIESPLDVRVRFEEIVTPVFEKIRANVQESGALSKLRDLLLPKLLSGELSLTDAESQLAEIKVGV